MNPEDRILFLSGQVEALSILSASILRLLPNSQVLIAALLDRGKELRDQAEAGAIEKARALGFSSVCLQAE
ncbi:MAG: hypothetical protein ACRETN_01385, partial [Nevskiales bacterium]